MFIILLPPPPGSRRIDNDAVFTHNTRTHTHHPVQHLLLLLHQQLIPRLALFEQDMQSRLLVLLDTVSCTSFDVYTLDLHAFRYPCFG
jgi:hypothetical protein